MKAGDIIRHCKKGYDGIIISVFEKYAEVLWTYPGMYNPETCELTELELVKSANRTRH